MLRATFLSSIVLLAACAGPPPLPEREPLRLLELGDAAEVRWPGHRGSEMPEWLGATRIGEMPRAGRVARVPMLAGSGERDSRAALVAPSGAVYRFSLELPPRPLLRLGLGYAIEPGGAGRSATFRVVVTDGDRRHRLLLRPVELQAEGAWRDVELDLEPWQGEDVTLELKVLKDEPEADAEAGPPVWAAWGAPEIVSRGSRQPGWDVLLVSLDTLRADRLSSYGHHRRTSPHLDALAAEGLRFATAVSQAPWTRPSHRALMSGLYPVSHGGLPSPALAWVLWLEGYRTRAITGGGQVDDRFGFHDGFERYEVKDWLRRPEEVVAWLESGRDRRDFLFLHTFEIHDPYDHAEIAEREGLDGGRIEGSFAKQQWLDWEGQLSEAEKAYVEALYDGGIAYADARLGELFAELDRRGLLERTIVVVTSDHGEQFWEHGSWRHGAEMYDHQLLVPLIVHLPPALAREQGLEAAGRVIEEQVRLIDLYPTLLDLLGIPLGHQVHGRSLRPLLEGRPMEPQPAYSENTNIAAFERKSLRTDRAKLIYSFPRGTAGESEVATRELYDLARDPREQRDLAAERPEVVERLELELRAIMGGAAAEGLDEELPPDLDPDLRERLEALGYLGR